MDDGSTDGTEDYIKNWLGEEEFKIIYVKKENGGMHTGYNKAFDLCETEMICCLETDDQIMPDAVEVILRESKGKAWEKCIGLISTCRYIGKDRVIGKAISEKVKAISYVDCYYRYRWVGDKFFVYKMSVIEDYRFPEVYGEKICSVSTLLLGKHGKYKVVREDIYNKSYLEDGFEQGGVKKYCVSPNGFAYTHRVKLREINFFKDNVKSSIHYIGCSLLVGKKGILKKSPKKLFTTILYPAGVVWYFILRRNRKRYVVS